MTPEQTGMVLAAIAARDSRTVGRADVMAWHEDIGDLDYADALAAVSGHFRESTDRIMPAHVRRIALAIRRDRAERDRTAEHLALTADRPAEGSPEASAVRSRLAEAMARDDAARAAVLRQPESRPCRARVYAGTGPCPGTVSFAAEAMMGDCDVCGLRQRRFAPGYGMADRQERDDISGSDSGVPGEPQSDETGPAVGPGTPGNSEAADSRRRRARLTPCGCGPEHAGTCPAGLGVGQ